ncbi:TPA: hypothetical protein N0F65_006983, partial [Lagenidium giganteum]
ERDSDERTKNVYKAWAFACPIPWIQACLRSNKSQNNLKCMLVSHAFVDLWRKIVEDQSFDKALFNLLDEPEQDYMRYCLNKCKISSREFDSAYNEQLDGYIKRLKMLQGAESIGDDNPGIKKEMRQLLDKLYEKGVFSVAYYRQRNNQFKIIWPTNATTSTYTITLPDGTYSASDINNYLQYWSIQNNLYLTNDTTGEYYYFISCAENVSSYAIQFTMQPVRNITGYTAVAGFPTMPVTAYTPQLQIIDSGFGNIVGYTPATYPTAQTTRVYAVNSDLVAQLDPFAAVVVGLSCLYNPLANNSQALHTFTSAGVGFAGLITTSQAAGIAYTPCQGQNNEITVSFYDQSFQPLQITDPNVTIRLLFRQKKYDISI